MLISLSEIINQNEEFQEKEAAISFDSFEMNGITYPVVQASKVHLRLERLAEKRVLAKAEAELMLSVPCDRCLKEVKVPFLIHWKEEFDFSAKDEKESEDVKEVCYIAGSDLDIDKLIYEEILLSFPTKVLCQESCKGICWVCGANLNKGECGCCRKEPDPRMSVIQDIFKNFKGV